MYGILNEELSFHTKKAREGVTARDVFYGILKEELERWLPPTGKHHDRAFYALSMIKERNAE